MDFKKTSLRKIAHGSVKNVKVKIDYLKGFHFSISSFFRYLPNLNFSSLIGKSITGTNSVNPRQNIFQMYF